MSKERNQSAFRKWTYDHRRGLMLGGLGVGVGVGLGVMTARVRQAMHQITYGSTSPSNPARQLEVEVARIGMYFDPEDTEGKVAKLSTFKKQFDAYVSLSGGEPAIGYLQPAEGWKAVVVEEGGFQESVSDDPDKGRLHAAVRLGPMATYAAFGSLVQEDGKPEFYPTYTLLHEVGTRDEIQGSNPTTPLFDPAFPPGSTA